ncbi:DUF551 domain-containing protein [Dorea sp. AM13-35]|nr:DUF551 domain-containing protein [Dorea sp. AM13-35]DAZ36078.1 MAG TPA: Protein of unknown function (DUF551) [Caudoviricetes sp.]
MERRARIMKLTGIAREDLEMRYTEYHAGKAVIKDKNKLAEAMEKLARLEDAEEKDRLGQWIPCSERLPEHYVTVLAQHGKRFSDEQFIRPLVLTDEEEWYGDLGLLNSEVIAWMPLPDPYKGADK